METKEYIKIIANHYMCNYYLAEKIVKSAEVNNTKKELDNIVKKKMEEGI